MKATLKTAMLMTAGLGTRLRPLTEYLPKPMLPLGDRTLLERNLQFLAAAGFQRVVLNLHHRGELLGDFAQRVCPPGLRLCFSPEDPILGSGGGIGRAASLFFQDEPVLVVNGDNAFHFDWRALAGFHAGHSDDASLLLLPAAGREELRTMALDGEGRVQSICKEGAHPGPGRPCVFSGIYVLEPRAHQLLPADRCCSVVELVFRPLLQQGGLRGLELDFPWYDIGTWDRYARAQRNPPR
jgi:NDP-sugar pyrophosphorylase family protein